jgi:hypothetical protein
MSSYHNAPDNSDRESAGGAVFIGNVGLSDYQEPEPGITEPATAMLTIDVISPPGSQHWKFHFVTLALQIDAPAGALFVDHSQRGNYHREVPGPAVAYWTESGEPAATLRVREDQTTLLSGPGNGRTYYVGIAGVGADLAALRFSAVAAGSLVRESSCHLVVDDLRAGDRIPGYLH